MVPRPRKGSGELQVVKARGRVYTARRRIGDPPSGGSGNGETGWAGPPWWVVILIAVVSLSTFYYVFNRKSEPAPEPSPSPTPTVTVVDSRQ